MSAAEARRSPEVVVNQARRLALTGAVTAGAVIGVIVLIGGAPVAWLLLGLCAVVVFGVLVAAIAEGRYVEPLTVIAAFGAVAFVVRPFYLFLNSTQLISFLPSPVGSSLVKSLLRLDNTEIAMFATTRLHGPLQPALTRAVGVCAVFLVVFVVSYVAPLGKRLGRGFSNVGRRTVQINVRAAVACSLLVGVIGQAAIVQTSGGLSKVANSQLEQTALRAGLVYYMLAGFAVVGVIVWAAWMPPRTRRARAGFVATALEPSLFYMLVGSRTHVLAVALVLVIVAHYRWRPLRLRVVVTAFLVGIVLAAALLAVRQATKTEPLVRALSSAPAYIADPRGVLNDLVQFDQLFYATSSVGFTVPYKHGDWIAEAFRSYVPHFLDPHKPQPPDITFRDDVLGNTVGAGRAPTLVGDLYFDYGFAAVAVGSAIVGVIARALLGLLSIADVRTRPFRLSLYGLSLFVLYELVATDYAIAIGYFLTLIMPFLVAVFLFGRVPAMTVRSATATSPAPRESSLVDL